MIKDKNQRPVFSSLPVNYRRRGGYSTCKYICYKQRSNYSKAMAVDAL